MAEREIIVVQQEHAAAMYEALTTEAERWQGINNLTYAEDNLAWQKQREKQLKQQLKNIKGSQNKLWEIACNCERSARKYGRSENYEKAAYFRGKWAENVWKQKEIQQQLKESRQKKKEAKAQLRQVKKTNKDIQR